MAHGKKKWITRYDGRIKRSNDRTKKDYYGELKWWYPHAYRWGRRHDDKSNHCPQCKHNYKPIQRHNDFYARVMKEIRDEWDGTIAERITEYNLQLKRWWSVGNSLGENIPRDPAHAWQYGWGSGYWEYLKSQNYRVPAKPIYDEEAWLCPKHRLMHDKKDEMWWNHPHGINANYQWMRKADYNYYRHEMKNELAKNYEDYGDYNFPSYRRCWLD